MLCIKKTVWLVIVNRFLTHQSQLCTAAAAITDWPCKMSNGLRVPSGICAEHYSSAKNAYMQQKQHLHHRLTARKSCIWIYSGVFLQRVCLSFQVCVGFTPTPSQSPKNMHGVQLTGDSKDVNVSMNGRLCVGPVTWKTNGWVHRGLKII